MLPLPTRCSVPSVLPLCIPGPGHLPHNFWFPHPPRSSSTQKPGTFLKTKSHYISPLTKGLAELPCPSDKAFLYLPAASSPYLPITLSSFICHQASAQAMPPTRDSSPFPCTMDSYSSFKMPPRSWAAWLSCFGVVLQTKTSPVQFPVRAHAWVAGSVPGWGTCKRQLISVSLIHRCFSPSLSPSLLISLKINK